MRQLKCATAVGVFDCLKAATEYVGVLNWADKMIGLGCNGQILTLEREQE